MAVEIDIQDFGKIERVLEDYGLGKLIEGNDPSKNLSLADAKTIYDELEKGDEIQLK